MWWQVFIEWWLVFEAPLTTDTAPPTVALTIQCCQINICLFKASEVVGSQDV